MCRSLLITCLCLLGTALALRIQDAEEGECNGIRFEPLPTIDLDFVDSLRYVAGGNRYHLYRHAKSHPKFSELRDFELYYNLCLHRNASSSEEVMHVFGFGDSLLGKYNLHPRTNMSTVYEVTPYVQGDNRGKPPRGRVTTYLSLTDYKTYAFIANCWEFPDKPSQRSWLALSLKTEISEEAKNAIEEHAISLGFQQQQIVFMNYASCNVSTEAVAKA